MLIVMDAHASAQQIEQVCRMITELGYVPHAMPGPTRTAIGITGNQGPISDIDQAQLERIADAIDRPLAAPQELGPASPIL
jgi:hypothetical protein